MDQKYLDGVSVEDEQVVHRITDLQQVPAKVRFLSCEPLIGPLEDLPLSGIHWAIVGGESGPGARPMNEEWVESILEQCREHDVAFFFKQWGGVRKKSTGRILHGRTYDELPQPPVIDSFDEVASFVLEKNVELYERLAQ